MSSFGLVEAQFFERVDGAPINSSADASRSAAFVDVNNDGFLDVFISNGPESGQNNTLYINQGNGTFSDNVSDAITSDEAPSDGATWGDIDNDGDLDLYVANWWGVQNLFYLNDGSGSFRKIEDRILTRGAYSETASWADFNKDGYLDLYVTNSSLNFTGSGNNLVVGNGDGRFTDGGGNPIVIPREDSRSVNWVDYDNDDDLDIFISNENNSTNHFYRNDDGTFVEIENSPVVTDRGTSMGSSWGDYDNDGDLDLVVANYAARSNFYRNDGNDVFAPVSNAITGEVGYSFGTAWGDVDNDGDLDLFVANAFKTNPRETLTNFWYLNDGAGNFSRLENDVTTTDEGWTYGAALGDYDNDGFLDLVVANTDGPQNNALYHNLGNGNNWVNITCEGSVSNRAAIGAKVRVKATINGNTVWQMREISSQSGYNCQNSLRVHFGLGDASVIETLIIEWPLGNKETFENVEVNKFHNYLEKIPDGFVRSNFKLEQLAYPSGEMVKFENLSVYDPNQETTFSWDFDGDGTEDSNEQSPEFAYSAEGFYDVSLTVTNADGSNTKKREAYVQIDDNITTSILDEVIVDTRIYPNPCTDLLTITVPDGKHQLEYIELRDLAGKYISREPALGNTAKMRVDGLSRGIYITELTFSNLEKHSVRIIKK